MRALITGGAGFIGSHLAETLIARGYVVFVVDDLSTGSIANLDSLKSHPEFSYTIDTIMNVPVMAELVDRADVIFHLAAAVGVRLIVENPVRTIETNIKGTEIVLDLANKKKKKVLIASSSEIYGKGCQVPMREVDDLLLGPTIYPRWSYACSKAIDEFLALAYVAEQKLPCIITRFFNIVGPRQVGRYGMVVPRLVQQALSGKPLTVYGDGSQTRSFCHVRDAVKALCDLAETPEAVGEVLNLGNEQEISITALAERVIERTGSRSEIRRIPFEEVYGPNFEDLGRRVPDVSKLRSLIAFEHLASIEMVIDEVAEYYSSREQEI